MSKHTVKLCSCGFPQSCPVPHEHDLTVQEKAIVKHFESRIRDLLKTRKDLLAVCDDIKKVFWMVGTGVHVAGELPGQIRAIKQRLEAVIKKTTIGDSEGS